jgi:hypothetical protein
MQTDGDAGRAVRFDMEAVVQCMGRWYPVGSGLEVRVLASDTLGTLRVRTVRTEEHGEP